jgi:cysteamine dioxygenase
MTSLFYRVFLQAKKCFGPQENFVGNFQQLKKLVNQITIDDLSINPWLATQDAFDCEGKSPCTFVNIYDSDQFTMTVFILRDGYTMPLHDHPKMHGNMVS